MANIILANMFAQITATTELLTAAYLSFKANKHTTLSYGQGTFCPINLPQRLELRDVWIYHRGKDHRKGLDGH